MQKVIFQVCGFKAVGILAVSLAVSACGGKSTTPPSVPEATPPSTAQAPAQTAEIPASTGAPVTSQPPETAQTSTAKEAPVVAPSPVATAEPVVTPSPVVVNPNLILDEVPGSQLEQYKLTYGANRSMANPTDLQSAVSSTGEIALNSTGLWNQSYKSCKVSNYYLVRKLSAADVSSDARVTIDFQALSLQGEGRLNFAFYRGGKEFSLEFGFTGDPQNSHLSPGNGSLRGLRLNEGEHVLELQFTLNQELTVSLDGQIIGRIDRPKKVMVTDQFRVDVASGGLNTPSEAKCVANRSNVVLKHLTIAKIPVQ